jgi:hypothetical protein
MSAAARMVAAVATLALSAAASTSGHHSFAAEYDANQPITLTGRLLRVDFVNPHAWLYVSVKDAQGREATWNIEMGSPNSLIRRGFTKDTVAAGTEVVIDGYRARDGSRTVNSSSVRLPDGRRLFTGSPGTGAPGDGGR